MRPRTWPAGSDRAGIALNLIAFRLQDESSVQITAEVLFAAMACWARPLGISREDFIKHAELAWDELTETMLRHGIAEPSPGEPS
jgi:hypothetical protein